MPLDPSTILAASGSVKGTDVGTPLSAALAADSPAEAVQNATAAAGYGQATSIADQLRSVPMQVAHTYWVNLTPVQQGALRSVGYQPPIDEQTLQNTSPGLLGGLLHGFESVAKNAWGTAEQMGEGVAAVGSLGLHVAGVPLSFVQHVGRATHDVVDYGLLDRQGVDTAYHRQMGGGSLGEIGDAWSELFSPSAWSRAWRNTANGEKSFDPITYRYLQAHSDPLAFRIAQEVASNVPADQIVKGFSPARRQQIVQLLNSGDVASLATQLNDAHETIGQEAVGEHLLLTHPALAHTLSGTLDALGDVASDPTMALPGPDAIDAARFGISGARALAYAKDASVFLDKPAVLRRIQYAGSLIEHGGYDALIARDPVYGKIANQLGQAGVKNASDLYDFMKSEAGVKAVLSGEAAQMAGHSPVLPHLSQFGWGRLAAKGAFTDAIDWLAEHPKSLPDHPLGSNDIEASTASTMALDSIKALPATLAELAPTTDDAPAVSRLGGSVGRIVLGGPSKLARVYRQLTTLTATKPYIDLMADDAPIQFRRTLQYALPRYQVSKLVDAFTSTPDLAQRFRIVKGGLAQMLHVAGVYSGPRGTEFGDALLAAMEENFHNEAYSVRGIDEFGDKAGDAHGLFGGPKKAALLETQLSDRVHLPMFREVLAASRRDRFYYGLGGVLPDTMDKFMQAWKSSVLMRPGFAVRVSGDEVIGNALRNGGLGYLQSRAALTGLKAGERKALAEQAEREMAEFSPDPQEQKTLSALASVASKVPHGIMQAVRTPKDLAAAVIGEAAHSAYRVFGGGLSREQMYEAAQRFNEGVWDTLTPKVASVAHSGGGYDMQQDITRMLLAGEKPIWARMRTAGYSEALPHDDSFQLKWHFGLDGIGRSKLGQAVLENIDKRASEQTKAVLRVLQDPEFADQRAKFARNIELPDGRVVGSDASEREALRSWASKIREHVNAHVRSGDRLNGKVLDDVVQSMIENRGAPDMSILEKVAQHDLPESVYGPDVVPLGKYSRLVQTGFNSLSRIIDWTSRQPITLQAFAESYYDVLPAARQITGGNEELAEKLATDLASQRAFNMVKPFVHNPEIRSQFEVAHRSAMPFLFAQDQFIKRWVKTFVDNPVAIRKAQLGINGLQVSGFVQRDQNGNDFFHYPMTQTAANIVAATLTKIGIPASLPINEPFTGQTKSLLPGLSNPLTPSVGPIVSVPMKALSRFFPELQPVNQAVLQQGASESLWEQIFPTTLDRLIIAATANPDTNSEFASAMMGAIQDAEATGYGLAPNATPEQQQAYINRITNWTRVMFFTKAALGFFAPASPTQQFDPNNFSGRLQTLLSEMPYNQAITEFLKENPDATPYTVFKSQEQGDVPNLPSTNAAGAFLDANRGFVAEFPKASGWFIPRTTGNGAFDSAVYREQISYGMRGTKTPTQFLQDVLMAPGAQTYYQAIDAEQAALTNATGDSAQQTAIKASYDQWKAQFMAQNPALADYLTNGAKADLRAQTIRELNDAIYAPNAPTGPQASHVAAMVSSYDQYEQAYASVEGQTGAAASAYRKQIDEIFTAWGTQYAAEHSDVTDLWNVLILPEMGYSGLEQGLLVNG